MHVPSATRVLAALLLLLPACPTSYATNPCVGHRNVIEGVATSETDADTVVSNTTANINGCGNVVAGNTLAVGKVVIVQGSDNIVESNVQTRADKDLRVVGNNNAVVGNVGDYVAVVLNSNVRRATAALAALRMAAESCRHARHVPLQAGSATGNRQQAAASC